MATIYLRGKSYYLQWQQAGNLKRRSLGKISKTEAETIRYAKEVELRTGENILATNQFHLFESLARQYLNWHKHEYPDSHNRIYQITTSHLIPFFDSKPASIGPLDAENYKVSRKAKVAIETVNKELRTLKAILNKGVEWGIINKNNIKSVKPIKNTNSAPLRYFKSDELKKLYQSKYAPIWKFMANTGLRRSEAQNLKWEHVLGNKIHVVSTSKDRTKSGKWREVPLSPGALEALTAFDNTTDYVLPVMTKSSLSRAFKNDLKVAGIEGSLHCLRHTFCSHLVMSGIPLRTVQKLAGHASFKTTEGYAHLSPDHLQASVEQLDL